MNKHTDGVRHTRPRRGLPRHPGDDQTMAEQAAPSAPPSAASTDPAAPAKPTARRSGLPRPSGIEAGGSPISADARASEAPAPRRREGLPHPDATQKQLDTSPAAPPTTARRSGLTAPATAGAGATAEKEAAPAGAAGRRAGLGAPAPDPNPSSPSTGAPAPSAAQATEKAAKPRWLKVLIGLVGLLVLAGAVVLLARWLRTLEPVQAFLVTYPGESHLPETAPVGFPAWLGWQHFLNAFFIVLIIRTGWQVRTQQRPPASWTRNNTGLIKTKNPPKKISLTLWAHLALDALWFLNGIVFVVMLWVTGQWMRVVPTSWDVFPNALSSALQYLSMNWPVENGWVNYNSLQLLAYFTTIFIAAPLAAITGLRMSGAWPAKAEKLNRIYPMELARAIHFPVMLYFTLFVIMHVFLVFATGALRNLNHMYASQDTATWTGFWIFFASLVVTAGAVVAARPIVLAPIAQLMGRVGR